MIYLPYLKEEHIMKFKQGLAILMCTLLLFGCTKKEEPPTKDVSDIMEVSNMKFKVEDTTFYLYQPMNEVLDKWTPDPSLNVSTIPANDQSSFNLFNKADSTKKIFVTAYNPESNEQSVENCIIMYIAFDEFTKNIQQYELPQNFKLHESKEEDVFQTFGIPMSYQQTAARHTYLYQSSMDYHQTEQLKVDFDQGILIGMELRGTPEDMEKKTNTFLTETVLKRALIPFSPIKDKSTELSKGIMVIEGNKIAANTPLTTLLHDGWTCDWASAHINNGITTVSLKKNDAHYTMDVSGEFQKIEDVTDKNIILSVDFDANATVEFPENLTVTSSAEKILEVYGAPTQLIYTDQNTGCSYIFDDGLELHLTFDLENHLTYTSLRYPK